MKPHSLLILKPGYTQDLNIVLDAIEKNEMQTELYYKGQIGEGFIRRHYLNKLNENYYEALVEYMTKGKVRGVQFDPTCIVLVLRSTKENETPEEFAARSRQIVTDVLRPNLSLIKKQDGKFVITKHLFERAQNPEVLKNLSEADIKEIYYTANGVHLSDSPDSFVSEFTNMSKLFKDDEMSL